MPDDKEAPDPDKPKEGETEPEGDANTGNRALDNLFNDPELKKRKQS